MDGNNVFAVNDEVLRKFDDLARNGSPRNPEYSQLQDGSVTIDYLSRQVATLKEQLDRAEETVALERSNSIFLKGQVQSLKKQLNRTTKLVAEMKNAPIHVGNQSESILPALLLMTNTSDVNGALTILRSWEDVYSHCHGLHDVLSSALNLNN